MKNSIVLDCKVQKDVKIFNDIINFNVSVKSGQYTGIDNSIKNRFTFIKSIYVGEMSEEAKNIIRQGNYIRVIGKLDSEQYQAKSGKIVYNKILIVNEVKQLVYDVNVRGYVTEEELQC